MVFTFRKGDIPQLDLEIDRGSNFTAWLEEWTAYAALSGLNEGNAETQYNVLRLAMCRETANVVGNLGLPEEDRRKVDQVIAALKIHVAGSVNETVERRNFRKRKQYPRESFDDYMIALRELVKTCNYCSEDSLNIALRDQIIEGLQGGDTVEELLRQKRLTLDQTLQICRAHESARHQREAIKSSHATINRTSTFKSEEITF